MIIQHNMQAMFTNDQLKVNNRRLSKSAGKLSSGYRINNASDDAAGLSISEKMRGQIRGLTEASFNAQNAVSFCEVADGAMGEIQEMLHRIRELSVQAANDTNTREDREAIQLEVEQLKGEIGRITDDTEYNTIKVFQKNRLREAVKTDTATSTSSVVEKVVSGTSGNNYGIAEILGKDYISQASKLNEALNYSGTGWTTTGNYIYSGNRTAYSMKNLLQAYGISNCDYGAFAVSSGGYNTNGNSITYTSADGLTEIMLEYNGYEENGAKLLTSALLRTFNADGTQNSEYNYMLQSGYIGAKGEIGNQYGSAWLDFSRAGIDYDISSLYEQGFNTTCATCSRYYSIQFIDGSSRTDLTTNSDGTKYKYVESSISPGLEIDISNCTNGEDIVKAVMSAVSSSTYFNDHYTQYAVSDSNLSKLYVYDNRVWEADGGYSTFEPFARKSDGSPSIFIETVITIPNSDLSYKYSDQDMWIQVGANSNQGINLKKPWLNNTILGINGIALLTGEDAGDVIAILDTALGILSKNRTDIGAYQVRFECVLRIDDSTVENTQSSESKLRDLDMADEMKDYAKLKILEQAAQAMLSQANSGAELVLQLLR